MGSQSPSLDRGGRASAPYIEPGQPIVKSRDKPDFAFLQFSSEIASDQDIDRYGGEYSRDRRLALLRDSARCQTRSMAMIPQALARAL
jgi:hypothetical protein